MGRSVVLRRSGFVRWAKLRTLRRPRRSISIVMSCRSSGRTASAVMARRSKSSGAAGTASPDPVLTPQRADTIQAAIERSLPLCSVPPQYSDGRWLVVRQDARGALQPYFDNGFPHGVDQWISAAGTSWATMALTFAARAPAPSSSAARTR
jgi:hypothetical protein